MSDELWGPPLNRARTSKEPRKICKCCGRKLLATWFERLNGAPGGRNHECNGCRRILGKKKPRKARVNTKCMTVKNGDFVISKNKKYEVYKVYECNHSYEWKGLVSGFRVMSNGEVMRRTTVFLGTDWAKV